MDNLGLHMTKNRTGRRRLDKTEVRLAMIDLKLSERELERPYTSPRLSATSVYATPP